MPDTTSLHDSFSESYEEYADAIFRHCYFRTGNRELAKEIMQDTFVKTWQYLQDGKEIENLRAFLYRTATNLIIDHSRKQKNRQETSLQDLQEQGWDIASDEHEGQVQARLDAEQVTAVLQQIDETYREVLIMRYVDELPPRDIAELTGLSTNVVSVRISRGMKQLQSLLPNNET